MRMFQSSIRFSLLALATIGYCAASFAGDESPVTQSAPQADDAPNAGRKIDYAAHIQPLFAKSCYGCHGPDAQESDLRLDRKVLALQGGAAGKVILPGKSGDSPLYQFVAGLHEHGRMPPEGEGDPLSKSEIELIKTWIDQGAAWPDDAPSDDDDPIKARAKGHWSFAKPVHHPAPSVKRAEWLANPIDAFLLAKLEGQGIEPSPEADRHTLIRRLSLDLRGLQPSPDEIEEFVSDAEPDAYDRLVARMLASPQFGERWGRHWLDLARYADSNGYEADAFRPSAWRYRNWVIDALNADMPYDEFTIEQLAGDLLPEANIDQLVATGFHRQTLINTEGGTDQEEFRLKAVSDRVNTTGSVWLGLTVGCAECHNHKYDPLAQTDYYRLFAFYNNAVETDYNFPGPALADEKFKTEMAEFQKKVADLQAQIAQAKAENADPTGRLKQLINQLMRLEREQPKSSDGWAMIFRERTAEQKTHVHVRGDFQNLGVEVQPGTPGALPGLEVASLEPVALIESKDKPSPQPSPGVPGEGAEATLTPALSQGERERTMERPTRLHLARWLVSSENPLTARVAVNRVWSRLFGRGIVASVDDFGIRGEKPTHPELLDWLATDYVDKGWSTKALIRQIVTTSAYRQASTQRPELHAIDPDNALIARQQRFRVEAEIVRDLNLAAGNLLYAVRGEKSVRPPIPDSVADVSYASSIKWEVDSAPNRHRRGVYIAFQRTIPYPSLMTFDCPDGVSTAASRGRSNTPLQALTTLNDPVFVECAQALGRRIVDEGPEYDEGRLHYAGFLTVGRDWNESETGRLLNLLEKQRSAFKSDPDSARAYVGPYVAKSEQIAGENPPAPIETAAWTSVASALLNLDEFITRE